jgi:hypothetical protein
MLKVVTENVFCVILFIFPFIDQVLRTFGDFFYQFMLYTGNMWVVWTGEHIYNGCLLTLLILPYNLFKYSSAGNITIILPYWEVTN